MFLPTGPSETLPESKPLSEDDGVPPAVNPAVYPGNFERQVLARCGMHALNNAIGYDFLGTTDLDEAADVYLAE